MEDNEDEPEDVKKATPVADEIKSGNKDEKAGNPKATAGKKKDDSKPSRCDKNAKKPTLAKSEADCCRSGITKPTKTSKMMSVLVYSPPCTLPRLEIIPRHCLSKQEYIDVLAAPSRKCPPECLGKTVIRKIRPISARMNELAQPARRLIVSTLQERGEMLPPEMIDNLVKSIEGSACMSPEQAEQYFKDKERKRGRRCGRSKAPKMQKCREKSKSQCPSSLDKEAVMCQYMMAERFVKSILQWKCPIPVEEFQDIASVILRRLSFVLEYTTLDEAQDIKSQQMRFLADIIACWISGVLFEVAEEHKKEIEEQQIADEEEEEEEEEDEDDEDTEPMEPMEAPEGDEEEDEKKGEDEDKDGDDTVIKQEQIETQDPGTQDPGTQANDEEDKPTETPVVVKDEPSDPDGESAKELEDKLKAEEEEKAKLEAEKKKKQEEEEEKARLEAENKKKQEKEKEEEEEKARKEAEKKAKEEAEEKKKKEMEEAAEAAENAARLEEEENKKKEAEEEKKRKEAEEEEEKKKEQKEAEDKKKREEEEEEEAKKKQNEEKEAEDLKKKQKEEEDKLKEQGPKDAIDKIGDGELFKSDIPFVTFGKILDTIYTMIEDEPEGDESDIIHNRIQRALYEKFANLIELESPDALTENLKDIVDVLSGKTATWIQKLLKVSEVKFMDSHPPEVESKEIRDWSKWIEQVTDRAGDWAEWIHRVVNEAETKSGGNVKRGDWQNWTSDTETNALLWRRYYLETVHQAHHNKMMMADRPVVNTGGKTAFSPTEEEIKSTDLED